MANKKSNEGAVKRCVWGRKRHGVNMTNRCMIKGEARQAFCSDVFEVCVL